MRAIDRFADIAVIDRSYGGCLERRHVNDS